MDKKPPDRLLSFWTHIMEKLDNSGDLYQIIPEVLGEVCRFFDFGCGFLYEADHTGLLYLRECYAAYTNVHAQKQIDLPSLLGEELAADLTARKTVVCKNGDWEGALEGKLGTVFQASSMVLIPVTGQERELIALVGAVDRRGESRMEDIDVAYSVSILRSIAIHTKIQLYQLRNERTQQALVSVLDNIGVDIHVNDFLTCEILYANRSMAAAYGGLDNLVGKPCWQLLGGADFGRCEACPRFELLDENGEPTKTYSWDCQRPVGDSWYRVRSAAFRWVDGRLAHIVSSIDITENKRNEALVQQMADYDALTGLPNRRRLQSDLERLSGQWPEGGYLLFMDLDGFKVVNDTLGHRSGDELLRHTAHFLEGIEAARGNSYRYGGDEFVILCEGPPREEALALIALLLTRFEQPWKLTDGETICRCSIGVACYPDDSADMDMLLHCADTAMYAAKKIGGTALFYNGGEPCSPEEYLARKQAAE